MVLETYLEVARISKNPQVLKRVRKLFKSRNGLDKKTEAPICQAEDG